MKRRDDRMIVQEKINDKLIHTYSDAGFYIHGGVPEADYIDAVDPIEFHREYVETDIPIEKEEEPNADD